MLGGEIRSEGVDLVTCDVGVLELRVRDRPVGPNGGQSAIRDIILGRREEKAGSQSKDCPGRRAGKSGSQPCGETRTRVFGRQGERQTEAVS